MRLIKFLANVEIGFKAFKFVVTGEIEEYLEHNEFKQEIRFNPPTDIDEYNKEDYEELLNLIETKLLEEWKAFNEGQDNSVWNQKYVRLFNINVMPDDDGKIIIHVERNDTSLVESNKEDDEIITNIMLMEWLAKGNGIAKRMNKSSLVTNARMPSGNE